MVEVKIDTPNESCQFQLKRNPIFLLHSPGVCVYACVELC